MPGKRFWVALGCGAFLAFALGGFPAGTAYRWLAPPGLHLAGITGTLWAGRAPSGTVAGLPVRDVEWRVAVLPLLLGRVRAQLSARLTDGFFETRTTVTLRTLEFTGLRLTTTLESLAALLPLEGAQGVLSLDMEELRVRDNWPVAASGTLRLRQLAVPPLVPGADAALVPLGDYELTDFVLAERRWSGQLRDAGGVLEVAGVIALSLPAARTLRGAVPTFDGRVRERGNLPRVLREPLEFLTLEVDPDGWRTLDLDPWLYPL